MGLLCPIVHALPGFTLSRPPHQLNQKIVWIVLPIFTMSFGARPLPSVADRGQTKVCVLKIRLKFTAPLINFLFCLRKSFLV